MFCNQEETTIKTLPFETSYLQSEQFIHKKFNDIWKIPSIR